MAIRILTGICSSNLEKDMDIRYSFSQRVIDEWNKLPNDCVKASSVNICKRRTDIYMTRAGYT